MNVQKNQARCSGRKAVSSLRETQSAGGAHRRCGRKSAEFPGRERIPVVPASGGGHRMRAFRNQEVSNSLLSLLLVLTLLCGMILPVMAADGQETESAESAENTENTESTESTESAESTEDTDSAEFESEIIEYEIIYIETVDDLLTFAENCRLDTWSQDKQVELQADLNLQGVEFTPIASFGGIFNGNGFTISGLYIAGSVPKAGLFAVVQETATVRDLHVSGQVSPDSGSNSESAGGIAAENYGLLTDCSFSGSIRGTENTGGIAGINAESGRIVSCSAAGAVFGESMTGGIAGANLGVITDAENAACVNIESGDAAISLADLDLNLTGSLVSDLTGSSSDTGGIAGYNAGIILNCENTAAVGYPHVGYNTGGIAGRSCGYLLNCENSGAVQGRKDVGGIAGQIEPYISVEITADLLEDLETGTAELQEKTESLITELDADNAAASERLDAVLDDLDDLSESLADFRIYGYVSGSVSGGASAETGVTATADPGGVDTSVSVGTDSGVSVDVTDPSVSVDTYSDQSSGLDVSSSSGILSSGLDIGTSSTDASGASVSVTTPDVDTDVSTSAGVDVSVDALESSAGVSAGTGVSGGANASAQLTVTTSMSEIAASLTSLTNELRLLGEEVSAEGYELTDRIQELSDQAEAMADELAEALENPDDTVSDTSAVDIDLITLGKTDSCRNTGAVNGDLNAGGIAGAVAIEYTADPEDDASAEVSSTQRRSYEYKAVVTGCENTGEVTAKRDCAGGITGLQQLGLLTDCENYGDVTSESGDYVGGIAGLTAGTVRSCFVKCTLSGGSAVGGITGSGTAGELTGESSLVYRNYAMVEIAEAEAYAGAVSGMDQGEFLENYFVSDTLAGIAGLSQTGRAEPLTYEALCDLEGLPDEFRSFTLTFEADDTVIKTVEFAYGESFEADIYPEIPEKDGYYGLWDRTELEDLRFDTVVSVVYTQYNSALIADDATRDDGRQIFYLQGDFEEGDGLQASMQVRTPSAFGTLSTSFQDALEAYFEQLENQSWTEAGLNREILEQWYLELPDDGLTTHEIRYLPPDGRTENLEVYVKRNGSWEWVESEFTGSYLTFDLRGDSAEIAILSTMPVWWAWVLLALLVLLILLLILLLIFRRRRKKPKSEEDSADSADSAGNGGSGGSGGGSPEPATEQEALLLQRALDAESRLAGREAALEILRSGGSAEDASAAARDAEAAARAAAGSAGSVLNSENPENPENPAQPVRKHRWILPVVIGGILAVLIVLAAVFGGTAFRALRAWSILQNYTSQDELAMDISISATVGSAELETNAVLYLSDADLSADDGDTETQRVAAITQDGVSVFYADGTLYLENGSSLAAGGLVSDYSELLELAKDLFKTADLTKTTDGDATVWTLTAEGDDAAELLEILLPAAENAVSTTQTMRVELEAEDGELTALRFRADGTLTDAGGTAFSLRAEAAAIEDVKDARIDLPAAAEEAISSSLGDTESGSESDQDSGTGITSDLLYLVSAWGSLYGQDTIAAAMTLSADLGPLQVSQTVDYYETSVEGETVRSVQKNRLALYFSEDAICDEDGNTVDLSDSSLVDSAQLLEIIYTLCMRGEFECETQDDGRVYTLTLDEEGMEAVTLAIAPDAGDLNIRFTAGEARVTVENGTLQDISIAVEGEIDLLLAVTAVSAGAEISFRDDGDFTVPDAVIKALDLK